VTTTTMVVAIAINGRGPVVVCTLASTHEQDAWCVQHAASASAGIGSATPGLGICQTPLVSEAAHPVLCVNLGG